MLLKLIKYFMKEKPVGLNRNYSPIAGKMSLLLSLAFFLFAGCGELDNLITSKTPYEKYLKSLTDSGIINTEAGTEWKKAGEKVFLDTLLVTLPYKEILYFSPSRIYASGYMFTGKRGERIILKADKDSALTTQLFIDLFFINGEEYEHIASAENETLFIEHTIRNSGMYFLRIQPELLGGGRFHLKINNSPSLAFPVEGKDSRAVKSFWGDKRDGGSRDHKGVDIFADKGTPVIASEDGVVTRTGTNNLGGKVVWLSTLNKSLYYAHLDSQAVSPPATVKMGDTLGYVGNTGNARYTPPHLHFGIYYHGEGAVDPLPYIRNYFASIPDPEVNEEVLGAHGRITSRTSLFYSLDTKKKELFPADTPVMVTGSAGEFYKGILHNGKSVYVNRKALMFDHKPVKHTEAEKDILLKPDSSSIVTGVIFPGEEYSRVGSINNYFLIEYNGIFGWISN
jgi:peptidoglycan LD-endopeptidase LytH